MSETGQQLIRVRVTYDSDSHIDEDGYSHSRETTVWHGVGRAAAREEILAAGCHRAAVAYPDFVSRLLLGIIGVAVRGQDKVQPAFFVQPVGPKILQLGELCEGDDAERYYPVIGGLLAIVEPERGWDGKLSFRWRREADREVFETRLTGFRPAIRGNKSRAPLRALAYRFTQTKVHSFVMWAFHRWVRRRREQLLRTTYNHHKW